MFFDATIGAVKPYALGENRQQQRQRRVRPGQIPPAMPPSALTRDPMEVFVEAMRYQRPAYGVHSFDV
ncbi:hypothetical protein DQ04_03281000 [Trypanosoma grayi]|uniref:hypothetical protein n=1 Tax=Trypanosoma grayi TaxID=71804 RepID=UPI0004F41B1B|nr:hypothetical protein DQ04_03281000 [Trypanosoma grayi]KEG10797.1 hypothetical protein DQ04_03281000 [Trypanosoma grayi]